MELTSDPSRMVHVMTIFTADIVPIALIELPLNKRFIIKLFFLLKSIIVLTLYFSSLLRFFQDYSSCNLTQKKSCFKLN